MDEDVGERGGGALGYDDGGGRRTPRGAEWYKDAVTGIRLLRVLLPALPLPTG